MAKSKNHTAHNQTRKAHRNGIHKPKWQKYTRTKGMDPKYLRNLKWAKKHNRSPSEMSKYNRKKFVSKKLAELVKKKNLRLKKKTQAAAKGEKAEQTATPAVAPKLFTVATLSKYEKSRAILTPKQRTAKKWRFISRGDRRKEKIYGGSGLLKIKTILHKRYNAELSHRRLRMRKIKKTLPANTYVKFWTRTLLGPEKRIKKTHKQVLAVQEEKKKAKTKARQAKRAGKKSGDKAKDDKGKGKKGAEKPKAGKEKPKAGEKPKGEKPKAGEKPKTEKPKADKAEKPKADKAEKPKADKAEKPKADKAEKPKAEKAEKPKAEKAEKPKVEKPKGEEKPKAEKPKAQKPKAEKPKAEETPAA